MRHTRPNENRRRFLRSTALLGVVSTFLPRTLVQGEKPLTKGLPVRRDALGNPALPADWKDGPQALDTPSTIPMADPSQQSDKYAVAKQVDGQASVTA